jgi:hypothetical protein
MMSRQKLNVRSRGSVHASPGFVSTGTLTGTNSKGWYPPFHVDFGFSSGFAYASARQCLPVPSPIGSATPARA